MVEYLGNMYDPGFQPTGSQENKSKATNFQSCYSALRLRVHAHTASWKERAGHLLTPVVPLPEQHVKQRQLARNIPPLPYADSCSVFRLWDVTVSANFPCGFLSVCKMRGDKEVTCDCF